MVAIETQENSMSEILQLSLFEATKQGQVNAIALYDLSPRFAQRGDRGVGPILVSLKREFPYDGVMYRIVVTPGRITDAAGNEKDVLPGEREQLVEDVIRKFATKGLFIGSQNEVIATFSVYRIQQELAKHKHTFSKAEIKEALEILHKSTIEISPVTAAGSKKLKPLLSASAFPVLAFKDENDYESKAYVQFNPLVAEGIKRLAFDQIDYDWMMLVKGQLPRWIFKNLSLTLSSGEALRDTLELRASDIASGFGANRKRWREVLSEVTKAVQKLQELEVIDSYLSRPVMTGKRKDDVVFAVKFSRKFLSDRTNARTRNGFMRSQAMKLTGSAQPGKFHQISSEEATALSLSMPDQQTLFGPST